MPLTFRKPKGVYSRATGDFFLSASMGGAVATAPNVGFSPYALVHNNASDGSTLFITDVGGIITNANGSLTYGFAYLTLAPTTQIVAPVASAPLDPLSPLGPGVIYQLFNQNVAKNMIGAIECSPGFSWKHDYPICAVRPGYSFGVFVGQTNASLFCGFQWAVSRE